jgi:hypothetical protein
LKGDEELELKVSFWGEKNGRGKAVFEIENEFGNTVSFEVKILF